MKDSYFLAFFVMTFIAFSFLLNGFQYLIVSVPSSQESQNSTIKSMNYTFTWRPETQVIIDGNFAIEVSVWFENFTIPWNARTLTFNVFHMAIKVGDDDFRSDDYLGLTFDTDRNGVMHACACVLTSDLQTTLDFSMQTTRQSDMRLCCWMDAWGLQKSQGKKLTPAHIALTRAIFLDLIQKMQSTS